MSDRPIIFSAPMIRALLDGRKSMTRRILKPQPNMLNGGFPLNNGRGSYSTDAGWKRYSYAVGDRLWVREALICATENMGEFASFADVVCYAEDGSTALRDFQMVDWPWKREMLNARFMPRWASRLTLIVTDVRVQRLQEISEADAVAEGIEPGRRLSCGGMSHTAVDIFCDLWNSIHGPEAWALNPWVAALSFTVHRCNIDQMPGGNHE